MRARYESAPDPDGLLPAPFTLAQLRHVHEAVLGDKLRKDTFNRRMRERSSACTTRAAHQRPLRGSAGAAVPPPHRPSDFCDSFTLTAP
jgi:hypothetical protein